MPEMNGYELAVKLREREFPGKIVVMSAVKSCDVRKGFSDIDKYANALLEKPVTEEMLQRALDWIPRQ